MKRQHPTTGAANNDDLRPWHPPTLFAVDAPPAPQNKNSRGLTDTSITAVRALPRAGSAVWFWLALILFVALNMRSPISSIGAVLPAITIEFGQYTWLPAMLGAVPLLAFGVVALAAPRFARSVGSDQAILLAVAVLAAASGLRVFGDWTLLLVGTLTLSAAIGVLNVLMPVAIRQHLSSISGLAIGLYTMSIGLSAAIGAGASAQLQASGFGWRSILFIIAATTILATIVWIVPALKSTGVRDAGVRPSLLRSTSAWAVSIFFGLQAAAFYAALAWLPSILIARGHDTHFSAWLTSLAFIVEIPAALVVPWLIHRSRSQRLASLLTPAPLAVGFCGLMLAPAGWSLVFVIVLGVGFGAGLSTVTILLVDKASSDEEVARLSGMAQAIGYLLAAVGTYVVGYIGGLSSDWISGLAALTVLTLPTYLSLRIALKT